MNLSGCEMFVSDVDVSMQKTFCLYFEHFTSCVNTHRASNNAQNIKNSEYKNSYEPGGGWGGWVKFEVRARIANAVL